MFDDLAVFKPEDFHDRQPQFFGLKLDVDMEYHTVTVGEGAFDIAAKPGELLSHVLQQRAKSLDPILAPGIVLDEIQPEIGRGFVDVLPVQGRIVECQDGSLVPLPRGLAGLHKATFRRDDDRRRWLISMIDPCAPATVAAGAQQIGRMSRFEVA